MGREVVNIEVYVFIYHPIVKLLGVASYIFPVGLWILPCMVDALSDKPFHSFGKILSQGSFDSYASQGNGKVCLFFPPGSKVHGADEPQAPKDKPSLMDDDTKFALTLEN